MPTAEIATYRATTFRFGFLPPPASTGYPTIWLTLVAAHDRVSEVLLVYSPGNTMTISGSRLTVNYPSGQFRTHFAILQTERPAFFQWDTDTTGMVTKVALLTGEEFPGEGPTDTS